MGFGQGAAGIPGTGFQLLIIIFTVLFGVSLGQLIAAMTPSIQVIVNSFSNLFCLINLLPKVAVLFNPFIVLVLTTFCGVTIPYPDMMEFWRSWLYPLDPYTWMLSPMLSTELQYVGPFQKS